MLWLQGRGQMRGKIARQLKNSRFGIRRKKRKKSSNTTTSVDTDTDSYSYTASDSAETPLLSDEPKLILESSSVFRDIARAEVSSMERLERRKSIDHRMFVFQETVHKRMAQMEEDAKEVKIWNCTQSGRSLIKSIHLIDAMFGIVCIVYGSLILAQFDDPAISVAVTSLTFGSVMLLSSIMGVIGFTTNRCNRRLLLASSYTAPFIVWFYIFVITSTLVAQELYLDYLTEHMSVLYLTEARIEIMISLLPLLYVILVSLAVFEVFR